ncbi:MAG: DUF3592 domain-containing protein [Lentisphaerae bacterium]|nr:DUF3592 domain-containing protein [Lentisphaerota bacterium]
MEEYLKYLTLLFPVVGVGLIWGGLVYKRHLRHKVSTFQKVEGVVTGFASRAATHASGGGTVYHPIVEYEVDGNIFSVQSNVGYGKPKEKEGSKLDVMYDPADPSYAKVVKDYFAFPHIMIGIGITGVFLGGMVAYHVLR